MGKALQIRQEAADSPRGLTARRWPALLALARKAAGPYGEDVAAWLAVLPALGPQLGAAFALYGEKPASGWAFYLAGGCPLAVKGRAAWLAVPGAPAEPCLLELARCLSRLAMRNVDDLAPLTLDSLRPLCDLTRRCEDALGSWQAEDAAAGLQALAALLDTLEATLTQSGVGTAGVRDLLDRLERGMAEDRWPGQQAPFKRALDAALAQRGALDAALRANDPRAAHRASEALEDALTEMEDSLLAAGSGPKRKKPSLFRRLFGLR